MRILLQLFIQSTVSTFASFGPASFCLPGLSSHQKLMAWNIFFPIFSLSAIFNKCIDPLHFPSYLHSPSCMWYRVSGHGAQVAPN